MEQRTHDAVNVHGHRIAYSTVGEGPPLLLIPGNSMNSERWVECGYVDALSPQHQLILVDPLGHGESDKVADRAAYTRAHLTDHLLAVLDRAAWLGAVENGRPFRGFEGGGGVQRPRGVR